MIVDQNKEQTKEEDFVNFEEIEHAYHEHTKSDELPEILWVNYWRNQLLESLSSDISMDDQSETVKPLEKFLTLDIPGEESMNFIECMSSQFNT